MKILSVAVPLLIASFVGWISAQNILRPTSNVDSWLNMDLNDLSDRCESAKEAMKLDSLTREYEKAKAQFVLSYEEEVNMEQSNFVMRYIYNKDMIQILKKLIKVMQKCYDNGSPLGPEGVVEVMDQVLKQYAMKIVNIEPLTEKDMMCFGNEQTPDICKHLLPKHVSFSEQKVGDILKLGVLKNSTCEESSPYLQCTMKEFKKCRPRVRKFFQVIMSPAEVGICNNYPQVEDPEIGGVGVEIDEGMNDLFKGEEQFFSFNKLFHL